MSHSKGIYSYVKKLVSRKALANQSTPEQAHHTFAQQVINLEPFFCNQSHTFQGVICKDLLTHYSSNPSMHFKECLNNLAFWHCYGRAIHTLIPMRVDTLLDPQQTHLLKSCLVESYLPVGLISIPLSGITTSSLNNVESTLQQFIRLGVKFEIYDFSGTKEEFHCLESPFFKGVHFSLTLIRAASQTSYSSEIFQKVLSASLQKKFHTYSGGISLVHDFNFARKNLIEFCYGPLLMPAVTKYQILRIKDSLIASMHKLTTPSTKMKDGEIL